MRISRTVLSVAAAIVCSLPAFSQTNFQYQPYPMPGSTDIALSTLNGYVYDFNSDGFADLLAPGTASLHGQYLQFANTSLVSLHEQWQRRPECAGDPGRDAAAGFV
jgi:hypothetical protein